MFYLLQFLPFINQTHIRKQTHWHNTNKWHGKSLTMRNSKLSLALQFELINTYSIIHITNSFILTLFTLCDSVIYFKFSSGHRFQSLDEQHCQYRTVTFDRHESTVNTQEVHRLTHSEHRWRTDRGEEISTVMHAKRCSVHYYKLKKGHHNFLMNCKYVPVEKEGDGERKRARTVCECPCVVIG